MRYVPLLALALLAGFTAPDTDRIDETNCLLD